MKIYSVIYKKNLHNIESFEALFSNKSWLVVKSQSNKHDEDTVMTR